MFQFRFRGFFRLVSSPRLTTVSRRFCPHDGVDFSVDEGVDIAVSVGVDFALEWRQFFFQF